LALCTRLNWQFSVSFQVHIKSSSSYRIVSYLSKGHPVRFGCIFNFIHSS